MCYVFNCFAWTLDLVQRFITFALGCIMALVICCGMTIAIIAGIAYGYHYSIAEFLTFSPSDVTVYMRRGQFMDKPDLQPSRRSGDETYDLFSSNITSDYQDENAPVDTNPLSNTWLKAEDTRRYAEKLSKYSDRLYSQDRFQEKLTEPLVRASKMSPENLGYYKLVKSLTHFNSMPPNRWGSTVMVQRRPSDKIMKEFRYVEQLTPSIPYRDYNYVNFDKNEKATSETSEQNTEVDATGINIQEDGSKKSNYPMRFEGTTTNNSPIIIDYPPEETDGDNTLYKPV